MSRYVVHKHHLVWVTDPQEIQTPVGSRVVHVGIQFERPTVWVEREVGPYADNHPSKLYIKLMATGEQFDHNAIHLGSVQHRLDPDSDYETVWHLYQVKEG